MNACEKMIALLDAYLDGELNDAPRAEVSQHLETCDACREELREIELDSIPLHRYGYGYDYAGAIMWLASESGSYVTGQLINVNGGLDFT